MAILFKIKTSWLKYVIALAMLSCFPLHVHADKWVNTQYNTTEGNEFYVTTMKNAGANAGSEDLRVYLYATARQATRIRITNQTLTSSGGDNYSRILTIPANGQNGILIPLKYIYSDLADEVVDKGNSVETIYSITNPQDKALHVFTCNPDGSWNDTLPEVSLYLTSFYNKSGFEATNILPVEALERTYAVQTYHTDMNETEYAIVATEDAQDFTITMRVSKQLNQEESIIKDTTIYVQSNRGQTRLIGASHQSYSLSGTTICSNNKFILINGNQFARIPDKSKRLTNHSFEQSPSADKWGRKYVVTPTEGHTEGTDYVLLTAMEDQTSISKDGVLLTTLQKGQTYTDTINYQPNNYEVPYYVSNNKFVCYLFETSYQENSDEGKAYEWGMPTMTAITPMEMGVNSIIVAAFTATQSALDLPSDAEYEIIKDHYVNIVTKRAYKDSIYIDNTRNKITGFKKVPGSSEYYYVLYKIPNPSKPHLIGCTDNRGTFTIRMYGHSEINSYAYSAGSRVSRAVDMLIDDQYISSKVICVNEEVKFSPLIDFEYESLNWVVQNKDSVVGRYQYDSQNQNGDSVYYHRFITSGVHDVFLYVKSTSPICDDVVYYDTVRAQIMVDTLLLQRYNYEKCQGSTFFFTYGGKEYQLAADTETQHNVEGNIFTFQLNIPRVLIEIIESEDSLSCDIQRIHTFMVRPTYDTIVDVSACEEYVWTHTKLQYKENSKVDTVIDTLHTFEIQPYDVLPVTKEFTHTFKIKYGCDSTVTMRATLNKSYEKDTIVTACQTLPGGTFNWKEHSSVDGRYFHKYDTTGNYQKVQEISLDQPGKFIYIDSLMTKHAPYCDSIYVLNLTIYPRYEDTISVTICQNDTFRWDVNKIRYVGSTYHSPETNDVVLSKVDSLYTFTEILQTNQGCDSIYHLQLMLLPTYDTIVVAHMCDNAEYLFNDTIFRGERLDPQYGLKAQTDPYEYTYSLSTAKGCDSIVTLQLYVHPTYLTEKTDTICQSKDDVYEWKDEGVDPPFWCREFDTSVDVIRLDQFGTFTYVDSALTNSGCYDIHMLYLTVGGSVVYDSLNLCDNDTLVWHNQLYVGSDFNQPYDATQFDKVTKLSYYPAQEAYQDTVLEIGANGCDNTHYLFLTLYPSYEKVDTIRTCDNNNPYIWITSDKNGIYEDSIYFTPSSEYIDPITNTPTKDIIHIDTVYRTLVSSNGCDSVVQLYLTICPTYSSTTIDTICQSFGGIYDWVGHDGELYSQEQGERVPYISLDKAGNFTYVDSIKTTSCADCYDMTCDSIHTLQLTILPSYIMRDTAMISEEETYYWSETNTTYGGQKAVLPHDVTIYQDTTVQHTLQTDSVGSYTCDSVLCLTIIVGEVYRDTTYAAICGNETYIWVGKDQNGNDSVRMKIEVPQTQIYVDHHKTTLGFDSIFYLNLTTYPAYVGIDSMTTYARVCQDSEYQWKRPNGHPKRLYSMDENRWIDAADIPTNRQGVFTYKDSLYTINGCDSVYTLVLQIDSAYVFTDVIDICNNAYAIWEDTIYVGTQFTGVLPNDSMPVVTLAPQTNYLVDTLYKTITGCDSTRCLRLNVHPLYSVTDYQTTCDDNNQYIWETKDYLGSYYDTIQFVPSIEYLDPVTNKPKKDIIEIDTVFRSLTSVHGCDSIVQLHLTIYPVYKFKTDARICANDSIIWREKVYYGAGRDTIYVDPDTTIFGCDSLYLLDLKKIPVSQTDITLHICTNCTDTMYHGNDSSQIIWYPEMYPRPTNKTITYKATGTACDSIFNYRFIYHPSYQIDSTYSICSSDSVRIHDGLLFWMNTYYDPAENIVAPVIDTLMCDTLCAAYTCIGDDGLPITRCCDSIYTAHITVFPAYKHVDSVVLCSNEVYYWLDSIPIQVSGVGEYYYDTLLNTIHGCDSIYELYLTVGQSYEINVYETICEDEPYLFYDTLLYEAGVYYRTLAALSGCDSVIALHLTVNDTTVLYLHDTICATEKYNFYGKYLTEAGLYDTITLNEWGCKQYNYLQLDVIDTTSYRLEIGDVICADDDEILVYYEYSGLPLLEYSVLFTEYGHSQGFVDIWHAPLDTNSSYFSIPVPKGEMLPRPEPTYFDSQQGVNDYVNEDKYAYPLPSIYEMTIIMHNGVCGDTLQVKDTTISFYYPSWIHEQHWNDGIVLYNEIYNGGHEFSAYQWYENGDTIYGATKEYLYIPSELLMNDRGECDNFYQVELTRKSDGYKTMTCPICPIVLFDSIVPQKDYFAVVPTIVDRRNPVVHILSTRPGDFSYNLYVPSGNHLGGGTSTFIPNEKNYGGIIAPEMSYTNSISLKDLHFIEGTILITLTIDTGESRTFTIIIK